MSYIVIKVEYPAPSRDKCAFRVGDRVERLDSSEFKYLRDYGIELYRRQDGMEQFLWPDQVSELDN